MTSISFDNAPSAIIPLVLPVSQADSHLGVKFEYQNVPINLFSGLLGATVSKSQVIRDLAIWYIHGQTSVMIEILLFSFGEYGVS